MVYRAVLPGDVPCCGDESSGWGWHRLEGEALQCARARLADGIVGPPIPR